MMAHISWSFHEKEKEKWVKLLETQQGISDELRKENGQLKNKNGQLKKDEEHYERMYAQVMEILHK